MSENHPAATALRSMMLAISEDHWCAGWMGSLEFALWRAATEGDLDCGMYPLTEEEARTLRWLNEQSGGWWYWKGEGPGSGEAFITTEEWLPMYDAYKKRRESEAA